MHTMTATKMKKPTRQHLNVKRWISLNSAPQLKNQDEMFWVDVSLAYTHTTFKEQNVEVN